MKGLIGSVVVLALVSLIGGCEGSSLGGILGNNRVTVELVNPGQFAIDVEMYIACEQLIPEALLTSVGEKIEVRVAAGSTERITRDCDKLQALIIEQAKFAIGVGTSGETEVLRDGDHFKCGDTLTFTFSYPIVPTSVIIDTNIH